MLIAEDDEAVRYVYSRMKVWVECGFEVKKQVSDGREAVKALESENFDLILTDIRMPWVDGIELLKKIRESGRDTEVIFVSTYSDFEYARQGLILGAFDYILKPVKSDKLRKVLERAKKKLDDKIYADIAKTCVKSAFDYFNMTNESVFGEHLFSYLSSLGINITTMEYVAENFEISKDYFGKLFKLNFGIHFNQFYSVLKIEYSKALIRNYNYKAYEISEILGYSSRDYFTKIFREITGITPTEYKSRFHTS
ncbi:MAG: response regulator [Alistipes sp.]|nr:response regulator [Alistipes sp.]